MELLMIYKISPSPSLPKRGKERENFPKKEREKAEMTHSITRRAKHNEHNVSNTVLTPLSLIRR